MTTVGGIGISIHPSIDEQGAPIPFTRTPREFRSTFYGKGIDNVVARDPYAGLVVSMHGVGLPQKRYGTMPTMVDRDDPYSQKFIAEREPTHKEMIDKLSRMEQYAGLTSRERIWHNYLLMQVFDRLSLFFCSNFDITAVAAAGAHTKEGKAYYGATLQPSPLKPGDEQGQIQLRVINGQTVVVDPYPFDESPLRVSVRAKLIPKIKYKSQEEFREIYGKAQWQEFIFTLLKA